MRLWTGVLNRMTQTQQIEVPYEAHTSQREFHECRLQYDWRAVLGGTGSGKTFVGAAELIYLCFKYPGIETVAFSPTFAMIQRNILPVLRDLLGGSIDASPLVQRFNKGNMVITWQSGSTTWFNSLEHPWRAEGQSLDVIWVDEPRVVRDLELSFQVMQRRLRGSTTGRKNGYPILAYLTTTPDHPGSQLHAFCEDPESKHPSLKVIRMPIMDNVDNLPKTYIDNVIRTHTGGLGEQFVHGRFAMVAAGSFAFDYTIHVDTYPDLKDTEMRKIAYGVDFGWDNPSAIVVVGFDGDNRAYIIDEFYRNMVGIDELIEECKDFMKTYGRGIFFCDPTEKQTVESMKIKNINARLCKVKRDDGIRELGGRFPLQEDGRPRIYIKRDCVNTISELQTYNAEKKERDHAVDAIRYVVSSLRSLGPVIGRSGRVRW